MSSLTFKGAGAAFVVWLTYLNDAFSPLLWVLLALIFLDLVLNIHKEGQQFSKLGSAFASLGIPSFAAANFQQPGFSKYIVAVMCLAYLQVVIPQLLAALNKFTFSKSSPQQNAADLAMVDTIVQQVAAKLQSQAQTQADNSIKQAVTPGSETPQKGAQ